MDNLDRSIQYIKGVGPKTSLLMNRINIFSIEDLLMHFPRAYEDRSQVKPIYELVDGDTASVIGEVCLIDRDRYTRSGKHITRIVLKNETGCIVGVWYNQKYIKGNFKIGQKYLLYGRVLTAFGEKQIMNPEYESIEQDVKGEILPVYPSTKNLSQKVIRNVIYSLVHSQQINLNESLSPSLMERFKLCSIDSAVKNIHFPENNSKKDMAEMRLKFEELLILQLGLMMEKDRVESSEGIRFGVSKELNKFVQQLPFELTNAQKKAVNEILNDMKSRRQMNRLVQGDVGSGKTIVAVIALLNAVRNGYQSVMMAPTEILSSQHHQSLLSLYENLDINVELLSGKIPKKQREEIKDRVKNGKIDVLIGTHAVIQDDLEFKNLGLVITDEQHRFGVRQRALLNQKGLNPDVLVMTATPIPRTMALFIYGDLDISIIDELPPGRQKIDTYSVRPVMRQRVYNFVKNEVKKGRQAYVVCPLIDESDALEAESAVKMAETLQTEYLKGLNVGLMHGKMKPEEKDEIMMNFKDGRVDVLVSTTVIEVGINVPNAAIMVIENADRFGLAQLHQLRGRVGRGAYKSYCILISEMKSEIAKKRMKIMQDISSGFKIAEKDLELRGTGEFFGTRQHGLPELKLADIFNDVEILKMTNSLAKEMVSSGSIYSEEHFNLRKKVGKKFKQRIDDITFN